MHTLRLLTVSDDWCHLHEQEKVVGIKYMKTESKYERGKEREVVFLFISIFHSHTYHIHQHILSPPLTVVCLAPVSLCPQCPPPPPPPSSPPTFSFFTFAASVIFTLSPFFWSTGWHWWISLSCTGLGIKNKFARKFSKQKHYSYDIIFIIFVITLGSVISYFITS